MKKVAFEEHVGNPMMMQLRASTPRGSRIPFPLNPRVMEKIGEAACDFAHMRLRSMDENEIEMQVLMCASNGIEYVDDFDEAYRIAHDFNRYVYEKITSVYPQRFKAYATLPMQSGALAAKELAYCVENYGFVGGVIVGYTKEDTFADDREYDVLWETAQRLNCILYIHPTETPEAAKYLYSRHEELVGSAWSWGVDTATYVLRMMFSGVFDRYPELQVMMGHMGEMLPYVIRRIDDRWKITPMGAVNQYPPSKYLRDNIYVSISGNLSEAALKCAVSEMGVERIVFAVDYPFESNQQFADFIEQADISEEERAAICYKNAERLIGAKTADDRT